MGGGREKVGERRWGRWERRRVGGEAARGGGRRRGRGPFLPQEVGAALRHPPLPPSVLCLRVGERRVWRGWRVAWKKEGNEEAMAPGPRVHSEGGLRSGSGWGHVARQKQRAADGGKTRWPAPASRPEQTRGRLLGPRLGMGTPRLTHQGIPAPPRLHSSHASAEAVKSPPLQDLPHTGLSVPFPKPRLQEKQQNPA